MWLAKYLRQLDSYRVGKASTNIRLAMAEKEWLGKLKYLLYLCLFYNVFFGYWDWKFGTSSDA